jgi:hypothetical protein
MTVDKAEAMLLVISLAVIAYRYATGQWPIGVAVEMGDA